MNVRVLRSRSALLLAGALTIGIALAIAAANATGAFSSADTPKVAGVPLSAPMSYPVYLSETNEPFNNWATVGRGKGVPSIQCFRAPCYNYVTAYRWNANTRSWSTVSLREGTQIWVAPFAVDWSWVWTSSTGWLALQDNRIIVRWVPYAIAT